MEELMYKLKSVNDSYYDFVAGVLAFVKHNPSKLDIVLEYLNSSDSLTSSEVGKFICSQIEIGDSIDEKMKIYS